MIDRPVDYQVSPLKYTSSAIRHDEHILQNALYGRLTDDNILCEKCGGKLSIEIDTNFCKIFEGFTEQLKHILASKDHGNNKFNRTLKGYIFKEDNTKLPVHIKDGKVVPVKPDYEYILSHKKVKIYATKSIAKSYQALVKKELLEKGIDISSISFEIVDDISETGSLGINFSEGIEDFNTKFKLGLNKIATGFAASNGISRTEMPCTLDVNNEKIIFTSNVVPFFPYAALDMLIEPFRVVIENEFPTHTLILFTDNFSIKKKLVCYIDLFSTFQYYVILNHDYKGEDILKTYYQTIVKQEKPKIDIRYTRFKYLNIIAEAIGVSQKELSGKNTEEVYDYLETKYNQMTVSYELNLDEYIKHISSKAGTNLLVKAAGISEHLSGIEKEIFDATPDFEMDDLASIYFAINRIESESEISYRQNFVELSKDSQPTIYSTLLKMIELNNAGSNAFKAYGHMKFFQLAQFIEANKLKK